MAQSRDYLDEIRRIGRDAEMESILAAMRLVAPYHQVAPFDDVEITRNLAYGPHERHVLDVFRAKGADDPSPVLLFVHGGGFVRGDKAMPGSPFYDNIGAWAARNGMVGVTINYRFAPEHRWPAGAEDVGAAVDWVRDNIARHGGDPGRVFVAGTSAGAVHVASYLAGPYGAEAKAAGAILLSCLFDIPTCEPNEPLHAYFGEDPARYPQQSTLKGMVETPVPVLLTLAEFDPADFERQTLMYVEAYFAAHGRWPNLVRVTGENHFTTGWRVGAEGDVLSDQMLEFIRRC